MNPIDWVIICVIAVLLVFAVWQVVRRKNGKCGCCCGGCNGECGGKVKNKTRKKV